MPLRLEVNTLGDSKETAIKRFSQVEKRLERNNNLKTEYTKFMQEYEHLGHMTKIENFELTSENKNEYFLPHHPIINSHSTTTKVRVVFDASAKSTSGKSLNDLQFIGPTIQRDIFAILVSFRLHNYVMTADIEKMYRQILIDESQRNLQMIVWRNSLNDPLAFYKLNTITYGTSSASYLATRTLKQLAIDEENTHPRAASILQRDFYVDDLITGCTSEAEAKELQVELIALLKKGGFNLRKWNSNSKDILSNLPEDMLNSKPQEFLNGEEEQTIKTLGLWWDPKRDEFQFRYTPAIRNLANLVTKRTILSDISRLFDPLGVLSPILIRAKMLLQDIWKLKLNWDESLPLDLHTLWKQFLGCLQDLNELRIPRQTTLKSLKGVYEIHGFADSSERAYGGVVYLRHKDEGGNTKVSLICSKSRVSPLKTTSLPRLELCAALLLAELIHHVKNSLQIEISSFHYWTDSSVALAWIKGEPARWTTFVANRVAKIQTLTNNQDWKHIPSKENPADLISRGAQTKTLINSELWWHGPSCIRNAEFECSRFENVPISNKETCLPEERKVKTKTFLINEEETIIGNLLRNHSSNNKLVRTLAWILRFIKNIKLKNNRTKQPTLKIEEIESAQNQIIKHVQKQAFSQEIRDLKSGRIKSSSKILSLDPFIDHLGILRVGGRIRHSLLSFDCKHPILLPKIHYFTDMIVKEKHEQQLHCGPQTLLYALRQKYWIISGREVTRRITNKCLKCFRAKPKLQEQKMGDLPTNRITPNRPFLHSGVDFCGPFHIKSSKTRKASMSKSYVAVFICLATKAIHLELVSDLTTAAFLAAIRRFISRRGMCVSIHSDNGRTFVGANHKLIELKKFFDTENKSITEAVTREGIKWIFIPPYSPHTGGLWEAAVKSLKYHLVRVNGNASLSFEELNTIIIQIEAVLNSRPLTPMSNNPSDLTVLTPSHFLTGSVLTAIPENSLMDVQENRLTRWQRLQHLLQHFWTRWNKEYLSNLQGRNKWKTLSKSLKKGDLVILKEDHVPPLTWPLGRVDAVSLGEDGLVRKVSVKTARGIVTRNIHKVCLLPIET